MKKLTVGFVFDDSLDRSDGVQQYVLGLGEWLTRQGHEVHYLVGETKRTDLPRVHSLSRNLSVGFNQNRLTIPRFASKAVIKKLTSDIAFDVLHVQMPYSPTLAGQVIAAAGPQTAVVGTFHVLLSSNLVEALASSLRLLQRPTLHRFDQVMSVSAPAQQLAKKMYGLQSQVVPNVVDVTAFSQGKKLRQFANKKTIVFLGRLVPRKGAEYLIRAYAGLPDIANTQLVIIGKGPLQPELEKLAAVLGVSEHIEFTGFIAEDAKRDYFASANLAVFPSTGGESFGIVLIEAMAAGAGVVVAGNNPGYASVLEANPAVLVDPQDTDTFRTMLAKMLSDSTAANKLHEWQQTLVKQYDIESVGPRVEAVYQEALRRRSKVT